MEIEQAYDAFIKPVKIVRDELRLSIKEGTREDELCKGFAILYSGLFYNPPFLFVGINPGAGDYNQTKIKWNDKYLMPFEDGFEYLEYGSYQLAKDTVEVFELIGLRELLRGCVKTNLHYPATSSAKELYELLWILNKKISIDMYSKSAEWTKQLIEIINPKNIICEGAFAVRTLAEYYGKKIDWRDGIGFFELGSGAKVIGYKRRFSNILGKEELASAIGVLAKADGYL